MRLDPIPGGMGLSGPDPGRVGRENRLAVRGGTPGATMYFVAGVGAGSTSVPGCPGLTVEVANPALVGSSPVDAYGHAILSRAVPAGVSGRTVVFQAMEPATCRATNAAYHEFSGERPGGDVGSTPGGWIPLSDAGSGRGAPAGRRRLG